MSVRPGRLALGAVGVVVGAVGMVALADATLTRHEPVAKGSKLEIVVEAHTRGGERNQSLREMVEALLLTCRLEVTSDVGGEVTALDDDRFRATIEPGLDRSNQRQLRGCLEDWTVDHLRVDSVRFRPL
ncbi:MAG TPA: hypothetical protein VHK88_04280 [Aquihabitans sp.]|jgi:hypothetical protein|nr:hypothetical protein [Aquihabitans sp.]